MQTNLLSDNQLSPWDTHPNEQFLSYFKANKIILNNGKFAINLKNKRNKPTIMKRDMKQYLDQKIYSLNTRNETLKPRFIKLQTKKQTIKLNKFLVLSGSQHLNRKQGRNSTIKCLKKLHTESLQQSSKCQKIQIQYLKTQKSKPILEQKSMHFDFCPISQRKIFLKKQQLSPKLSLKTKSNHKMILPKIQIKYFKQ